MNHLNENKSGPIEIGEPGFHPQVKASLYPNSTAQDTEPHLQVRESEAWAGLVDNCIYPRIKFRERYMETPEAPYR